MLPMCTMDTVDDKKNQHFFVLKGFKIKKAERLLSSICKQMAKGLD